MKAASLNAFREFDPAPVVVRPRMTKAGMKKTSPPTPTREGASLERFCHCFLGMLWFDPARSAQAARPQTPCSLGASTPGSGFSFHEWRRDSFRAFHPAL